MTEWNDLEDKREAIIEMAFQLCDLNIFSDDTLHRMYNEMYEVEDKQTNKQTSLGVGKIDKSCQNNKLQY